MAGSFPITQDQLVTHLADQGFITNRTIQEHIEEAGYVKGATMRQWIATELRQEHDALEKRLVDKVQELHDRTSTMADGFDARVVSAQSVIQSRDDQLRQHMDAASIVRDEQFALLSAQLSKDINESEAKLASSLDTSVARLNELAQRSIAVTNRALEAKSVELYEQMKFQLAQDGHGSSDGGKGGSSSGPRERNIYDVRDYKIADLEKGASTAAFKKWKHDLELFVETIGPSWSGVTSLLRHCRLYDDGEFTADSLADIAALATKVEKREPAINAYLFKFDEKADALYKLVMPCLPVDLANEFRQTGGVTNGFELFRKLVNKLDPARSDNAFHLATEIRGLGGVGACKNFDQTVRFVQFFEKRLKEYLIETGEIFPPSDAARYQRDPRRGNFGQDRGFHRQRPEADQLRRDEGLHPQPRRQAQVEKVDQTQAIGQRPG